MVHALNVNLQWSLALCISIVQMTLGFLKMFSLFLILDQLNSQLLLPFSDVSHTVTKTIVDVFLDLKSRFRCSKFPIFISYKVPAQSWHPSQLSEDLLQPEFSEPARGSFLNFCKLLKIITSCLDWSAL